MADRLAAKQMAPGKSDRHEAIRRILRQKEIKTQQDLASELSGAGFEVTLATVSRDIAELNLVRRRGSSGSTAWALPEQEHLQWMLREMVAGLEAVQNMVIVKCSTGTAQGVAAAIDRMGWSELAGTVAGDDTILMIARSSVEAKSIAGRLKNI